MFEIDLKSRDGYLPLSTLSVDELFSLGLAIARAMPHTAVRAPTGEAPGDAVTLKGTILSKKGVETY